MSTQTPAALIEELGVKFRARHDGLHTNSEGWAHNLYRVKISRPGATEPIRTNFRMGTGITERPTAAEVLYSLFLDAESFEQAGSFEEWCRDFGMDSDSRKAWKMWKACELTHARLSALFGDDYERAADTFYRNAEG